jgi:hypothetical protein
MEISTREDLRKMTATQKRRYEMQQENLIYKAAQVLGRPESDIVSVEEHQNGCTVKLANKNQNIPHEIWVLGWTTKEYMHYFAGGTAPKGK